jgi:hypothetical protein
LKSIIDEDFSEQTQSSESITMNKDRQETAIFIFTVVTVIFLPLSTVSSYLGMNTSDIRDMNSKQWVFWAAAIPLTVAVLFLARLWAFPGLAWPFPMANLPASQMPYINPIPPPPSPYNAHYMRRRRELDPERSTGYISRYAR